MPTVSIPRVPAKDPSRAATKWASVQRASAVSSGLLDAHEFHLRPLQVTWEVTSECDWKATQVRTSPRWQRRRHGLSTAEAFHLVDEVAAMHVPLLALTGGDPLLRPDLLPIVCYAAQRSVRTSLTALPTGLLTREVISELKECGLMRIAFWLHGSTPQLHDSYWHVPGSYRRTLEAIGWCHEAELPVQINTTIARRNVHDLDPIVESLMRLDVVLWNVFCFVPATREQAGEMLTAEEHEETFARLYRASRQVPFQIKTTEGQHYQRYLLQQRARESRRGLTESDLIPCTPKGVNDAKGFVFVNHAGEVYPSRFLPLSAGNITTESLPSIYCESPLFVSLRDSSKLKGKCGRCPVRNVCGGSRARAYAVTGDLLAEEPGCAYLPQ
jgi:radical SAM protein with 4Fe4S-binding SPASM domain